MLLHYKILDSLLSPKALKLTGWKAALTNYPKNSEYIFSLWEDKETDTI